MSNMKATIFYHVLVTKAKEEEIMKLDGKPSMEWEVVQVRDEPLQNLPLFPWDVTKVLVTSDLGYIPGLELNRELVRDRIFKHWDAERVARVTLQKGRTIIKVHDLNTKTDHDVFFRKCFDNENFCFQGGWVRNFVARRNLRAGVKIGLYWDIKESTLCFSVLEVPDESSQSSQSIPWRSRLL